MLRFLVILALCFACGGDNAPYYIPPGGDGGPSPRIDAGTSMMTPVDPGPALFDPGDIYALATFQAGSCEHDVVVDFAAPTVRPGFPCDVQLPTLRSDGHLVYMYDGHLWLFQPDEGDSAATYPASPASNDILLRTPRCDSVSTFAIEPDTGYLVYACSTGWRRSDGSVYPTVASAAAFLPGHEGYSLLLYDSSAYGIGSAGVEIGEPVSLPVTLQHARPHPEGFWLLGMSAGGLNLFDIDFDGELTPVGAYDTEGYGVLSGCVVASDQRVHCIARDEGGNNLVVRLSFDAPPEVRYTPSAPVALESDTYLIAI